MITIHKYPVPVDDSFTIDMPLHPEVLCVQMQGDNPFIWARVDDEAAVEPYSFQLRGTGHPAGRNCGRYLGTFQLKGGRLVFHLFETKNE